MKSTFLEQSLNPLCLLIVAACFASGTTGRAADTATSNSRAVSPSQGPGQHPTKDAEYSESWKDPGKVLPEVIYDGMPIIDTGEDLRKKFDGEFDVLFPKAGWEGDPWDWKQTAIFLKLKGVRASEIFNAMNLVFETAKTPLHWDLMMNGNRPTALLRNLREPTELPASTPPAPAERPMVFFVGDLVGGLKPGGMTIEQVADTVSEVCREAKIVPNAISCHRQAQLLIIRGTEEDIAFVQSTLAAMREKAQLDERRKEPGKAVSPGSKSKETTSP